MLLKHTTKEIKERSALAVNPAKTCQPVGAMYAALGIHGCLPHSHGSQGCCSYHRSALSRHYKEPVMAGTSSFTEGASVFGGQANLTQAFNTMFATYDPEIIAVHTTCLSETIGDDIAQITKKAYDDGKIPEGKFITYTNTPSYVGSHVTGFSNMVRDIAKTFVKTSGTSVKQVNVLPGWVEPADMREIKRILDVMRISGIVFPDTSDVLDTPQTGKYEMYPKGGTTIPEMESMGDSKRTIACGYFCSMDAAKMIERKSKVKFDLVDIPYGLKATDRFVQALSKAAGVSVPVEISDERGRLMDLITDMHQYLYGKKVALWGDPDFLIPMCEFLIDIDMKPTAVVSGTPGKEFSRRMSEIMKDVEGAQFKNGQCADMFLMHQWIKNNPVDLLVGNSYGKYIAKDENIPLIRTGFPIYDRIGHQYFPLVGYQGAIRFLEKVLDAILDKKDKESDDSKFELVL